MDVRSKRSTCVGLTEWLAMNESPNDLAVKDAVPSVAAVSSSVEIVSRCADQLPESRLGC